MDRLLQTEQENERIVLGLLSSVETDGERSQRRIASELGIALGLVNAYLKRCVKKGLIKVSHAPARRYAYYLTPKGFSEKSRLTVQYLSASFSFFRQARADCSLALGIALERHYHRLVLSGKSDLAEIAILAAVDCAVTIVAIVDDMSPSAQFVGRPVVTDYDDIVEPFDAVMITNFDHANEAFDHAVELFGAERVLAPALLGISAAQRRGSPQ